MLQKAAKDCKRLQKVAIGCKRLRKFLLLRISVGMPEKLVDSKILRGPYGQWRSETANIGTALNFEVIFSA